MATPHVRAHIEQPAYIKREPRPYYEPSRQVYFEPITVIREGKQVVKAMLMVVVNDGRLEDFHMYYNPDIVSFDGASRISKRLREFSSYTRKAMGILATNSSDRIPKLIQFPHQFYKFSRGEGCLHIGHDTPTKLSLLAKRFGFMRTKGILRGATYFKLCKHEYGNYRKGQRKGEHNPNAGCRHHPPTVVKSLGRGKFIIGFKTSLSPDRNRERIRDRNKDYDNTQFVDLMQLAGTFTGNDAMTLDGICKALNVPLDARPVDMPDINGDSDIISDKEVLYLCRKIIAEYTCFKELQGRHIQSQLNKRIGQMYSGASVLRSLREQFGERPFREQHPYFPDIDWAMSQESYFGSRSEVAMRRTEVQVMSNDFIGMYATQQIILGFEDLRLCERIEVCNTTEWLRELVTRSPSDILSFLSNPDNWTSLVCQVRVSSESSAAHRLPVRDYWRKDASGNASLDYLGIAYPYVTGSQDEHTYWLPHILASALFDEWKPEDIVEAHSYIPSVEHYPTNIVNMLGTGEVDRAKTDILVELNNRRNEYKRLYVETGDIKYKHQQVGLKKTAVAAYGLDMEVNVDKYPSRTVPIAWTDIDGVRHATYIDDDGNVQVYLTDKSEAQGKWFSPFIGCVTAYGWLFLSICERLFQDRGINQIAAMDTDSVHPVKPDDITFEQFQQLNEEVRDWFRQLSPYPGKPHILELRKENYGKQGDLKPLFFWGVCSKKYVEYQMSEDGNGFDIVKLGRHCLGNYTPPYTDEESPFKDDLPGQITTADELDCLQWELDLWHKKIESVLMDKLIQRRYLDDKLSKKSKAKPKTQRPGPFTFLNHPIFNQLAVHRVTLSSKELYDRYGKKMGKRPFDSFCLVTIDDGSLEAKKRFMNSTVKASFESAEDEDDPFYKDLQPIDILIDLLEVNKADGVIYYLDERTGEVCSTRDYKPIPDKLEPATLRSRLNNFFNTHEDKFINGDEDGAMIPCEVTLDSKVPIGKEHDALAYGTELESNANIELYEPQVITDDLLKVESVEAREAIEVRKLLTQPTSEAAKEIGKSERQVQRYKAKAKAKQEAEERDTYLYANLPSPQRSIIRMLASDISISEIVRGVNKLRSSKTRASTIESIRAGRTDGLRVTGDNNGMTLQMALHTLAESTIKEKPYAPPAVDMEPIEYIMSLLERVTLRQVHLETGISERYLRFILSGDKTGNKLLPKLKEYYDKLIGGEYETQDRTGEVEPHMLEVRPVNQ